MRTIFKYPLSVESETQVAISTSEEIVRVGLDPRGVPCVWAIVDDEQLLVASRRLRIYGTGVALPVEASHVGSFLDGQFVWHVFDTTRVPIEVPA